LFVAKIIKRIYLSLQTILILLENDIILNYRHSELVSESLGNNEMLKQVQGDGRKKLTVLWKINNDYVFV